MTVAPSRFAVPIYFLLETELTPLFYHDIASWRFGWIPLLVIHLCLTTWQSIAISTSSALILYWLSHMILAIDSYRLLSGSISFIPSFRRTYIDAFPYVSFPPRIDALA